jgi:hypothetical protein
MVTHRFSIMGVMVVLAAVLFGCGPSKVQLRQEAVAAAKTKALLAYDQAKKAKSGDGASQARAEVLAALTGARLDLTFISVTKPELDLLVADKYSDDAAAKVAVLRDKKTKYEAAQAARTEFYRTQKLSGRDLSAFGVTVKSVDGLVTAAHRREILAHRKTPAKKNPARHIARRR